MAEITLTKDMVALVDDADVPSLLAAPGTWYAHQSGKRWYAARTLPRPARGVERMHTFLTGWPLVDHANGDGLDNRRANLRPATSAQNAANRAMDATNTSGFRGVSLHKASGLWRAYVGSSRAREWLGYFHSAEEAAHAYDAAALARYGEFARPNFPIGESA